MMSLKTVSLIERFKVFTPFSCNNELFYYSNMNEADTTREDILFLPTADLFTFIVCIPFLIYFYVPNVSHGFDIIKPVKVIYMIF